MGFACLVISCIIALKKKSSSVSGDGVRSHLRENTEVFLANRCHCLVIMIYILTLPLSQFLLCVASWSE